MRGGDRSARDATGASFLGSAGRRGRAIASRLEREVRREIRRASTLLSGSRTRIVFDSRYRFPASPLADRERATKIIDHLAARRWLGRRSLIAPPPLALVDLVRVHDPRYLETLDDPRTVATIFGEDAMGRHAADCLLAARWATAGTVHAAELALQASRSFLAGHRKVVVNLGGGFHHAHPDHGAGFCAFNDIAAAIGRLRGRGFEGRILVVDLDLHHGDGTRAFFRSDERVFTYSLHATSWDAQAAIAALDVELGPAVGDETYLRTLKATLPEFFSRAAPEIVFFVAGVDVADGDALGAYRVSSDGMLERDRFVFSLAGELPVVMTLAGGYGPDAWRHTARTLVWLLSGEDARIPTVAEEARVRFRRIRRRISLASVTLPPTSEEPPNFGITPEDLYGDLVMKRPESRLLGHYTLFGLELMLERYGLADQLRKRGYPAFEIVLDAIGATGRGFRIYGDATHREVLIELVLSEHYGVAPYRLLSIEWLLIQDPRRVPPPTDELMPGQRHPGLGASRIVVGMLVMACERLGFDGLTFVPAHHHVAARGRRLMHFLEPEAEARFLALAAATRFLAPAEASRVVERGEVIELATGAALTHLPARMVLAVSAPLKERFASVEYGRVVESEARSLRYELVGNARGVERELGLPVARERV